MSEYVHEYECTIFEGSACNCGEREIYDRTYEAQLASLESDSRFGYYDD